MANTSNKIGFLNLKNLGDTAIIRVLHSSVNTIERVPTHWVNMGAAGRRSVKCLGVGCPLCATNASQPTTRAYIHVIDSADMQEKVWTRTESFLNQLAQVEQQYGNLSNVAIKVVREESRGYPSYRITEVIPNNANAKMPGDELIDTKVAFRCFMSRTAEELNQFLMTGQMPEHKKSTFVPKAQYVAQNAPYSQFGGQVSTPTPVQPKVAPTPTPAAPVAQPTWTYNPTQTVASTATPVASMTPPTWTGNTVTPTPTPTTFPPQTAPANDDPFSSPIFRV